MSRLKEGDKKSMNILHTSMLAGSMIAGALIYYLMQSKGGFNYSSKSLFFIISAVSTLLSILLGTKVYITNINNAAKRNFDSYNDAMMNFRSANVVRWSLLNGASLIGIFLAFSDNNPFIFFPVMAGLFYLFVSKMKEEHFAHYKYGGV